MSEIKPTDPIQAAIFVALTASERLAEAAATAVFLEAEAMTDDLRSKLEALCGGELTVECFTWSEISRLNTVAKSLEPVIRSETHTWVVHDECSVSEGYEETATSALADALSCLHFACRNLADQLSLVMRLRDAERLAMELKQ